jgi:hypothetical protein
VRILAVVMLVGALVLGAGCGRRNNALGSGADLNACDAYYVYDNFFGEPSPRKADELLLSADAHVRLIDRIRPDFKISVKDKDDFLADKAVIDAWTTIRTSMVAFRERVKAAGNDPAKLGEAANSLAADQAFLAADARVAEFNATVCPHD